MFKKRIPLAGLAEIMSEQSHSVIAICKKTISQLKKRIQSMQNIPLRVLIDMFFSILCLWLIFQSTRLFNVIIKYFLI